MGIKKSIITQKIIVGASPMDVYQAFIDPKKHSEFTGSKATGKASVGSKFTAWDGYIQGKILELEKGKKNSSRMDYHRLANKCVSINY